MHVHEMRFSKKAAALVRRQLRTKRRCLLCGTFPASVQAIFVPNHPELWGGQRDKVRLLGYGLCARCFALPDRERRVEAQFAREYVGRRN